MSGQNAATHFNLVIERGVVQNMHGGMYSSSFGIVRSVDQRADTGVYHGSCTHGTRFDGYEKIAIPEPMIAECRAGFAQGDDFGVGGWVGIGQTAVESAAYDFAFVHYDCADGHFSQVKCSLSSP